MNLVSKFKEEFSKQPFSFIFGFIGFISIFANGATLQYLSPQNTDAFFQTDFGVLIKLCLFIVGQGALCAGCAAASVAVTKLGHGFSIIFLVLIVVIVTWLLTYSSFWFSTVGVLEKQSAVLLYMFAIIISVGLCLYFLIISFSNQSRSSHMEIKLRISSMMPFVFTLYALFGFGFFILFGTKLRTVQHLSNGVI